jgi:hypothetical protein
MTKLHKLVAHLRVLAEGVNTPSTFPEVWADVQREPWPESLKLRRGVAWMSGGGTGKSRLLSWSYDVPENVVKRFLSRLKTILIEHNWYILKVTKGNLKLQQGGSVLLEPLGPGAKVRTRPIQLFHASPVSRRSSILSKGLVPRKSRFNRSNAPRVYATKSQAAAKQLIQEFIRSFPDQGVDYDIFEIDVSQLRGLPLYIDQEQPRNCVWTDNRIPASALKLITRK